MFKEITEFDALGAEAMPGDLDAILRILQPAPESVPAPVAPQGAEPGGIRGFFVRRRNP